jgi:hypothetical protein
VPLPTTRSCTPPVSKVQTNVKSNCRPVRSALPQLRLRLYRSTSPGVPAPHSRFRYLYITGPPTPVQQVERDFSSLRVADTANILLASTPSKNKKKKGTIFFDDVRPVFCRSSSPTPSPHLVHAPGIFILVQRLPLEFYVASFQSRSG